MALTSEVISLLVINHFRFRHNLNGWRCYTIGEQQEDGQRKVVFVRQKLFEYVGGGITPPPPPPVCAGAELPAFPPPLSFSMGNGEDVEGIIPAQTEVGNPTSHI